MRIGGSIALLAIGAILSFAVRDNINDIDLVTVGYILMAAGALGLLLSIVLNSQNDRDRGLPPR